MTTLTATPQTSFAGGVRLDLTSAPGKPTSAYASNFAAGVDSWTNSGGTLTRDLARTPISLNFNGTLAGATASRTITGLTIGAQYRAQMMYATLSAQTRIGVTGIGTSAWVSGGTYTAGHGSVSYVALLFDFVATATSHTITVECKAPTGQTRTPQMAFNTITVNPLGAWLGTVVYRTDANGTGAIRQDVDFDIPSGSTSASLYDFDAALVGQVQYQVRDGLGALSNLVTLNNIGAGGDSWLTLPATGTHTVGGLTAVYSYAYRTNLVPNPSFEVNTTGWAVDANCAIARDTTQFLVGVASLKLTSSAAGSMSATTPTGTSGIPVTAGTTYTLSSSGRAGAGTRAFYVQIRWYNSAGALVSSSTPAVSTNITTAWTRMSVTGTAPVGTTYCALAVFVLNPAAASEVHYFDAVMLEQATTVGNYFDGATATAGLTTYAWSGTAHASSSTETAATLVTSAGAVYPLNPPDSASVDMVTGYSESSDSGGTIHWIVGRTDPIANPGALRKRSGSFALWCTDYSAAAAVRSVLSAGEVAFLRQTDFPGMDLYFVPSQVQLAPEEPSASAVRWSVNVAYDEVVAP